ncbi:unannotated protein [freshwater metagenome]|uniref:Unannotated protein n=1 Tax=freshwater metagenome TaxID=449393 RepID=A0A6J7DEF5_9ZZZZ
MCSSREESIEYSAGGRPETALVPAIGMSRSSSFQYWAPSVCSIMRGALSAKRAGIRPSKVSGGSTRWSSTEITV